MKINTYKLLRRAQDLGLTILAFVFMLPTAFVFFWMISLALKSQVENTSYPPIFLPSSLNLQNFARALGGDFWHHTWNTLIIATGTTLLGLLLGAPASFAVVRWNYHRLALFTLIARIVPAMCYLIPWFVLFRQLRLINTHIGLILANLTVILPLIIWMLISYFEDTPRELEDAAAIDGCSNYGIFWRIALPLAGPGVIATGIITFIFSWNIFLFAIVLGGRDTRVLPVAVYSLLTFEEINWGPLAAAAFLITVPVLVLTMFVQRYIVSGLSFGAVKG
jgi:multiple sugar transport system permease protein